MSHQQNGCRSITRRRVIAAGWCCALALSGCERPQAPARQRQDLRFWSGIAHPFTNDLAADYNASVPTVHVDVNFTGGSNAVASAVQQRKADLGIAQTDVVYRAFRGGLESNPAPHEQLRGIAVLWVNNLYVVVRNDSPIRSVPNLKGKRIGVLPRGTAGEFIARVVLGAYGLSYTSLLPKFSGESTMLRDLTNRNIEAAFIGYPFMSDPFIRADEGVGLRLLSLNPETHRLRGEYPFLRSIIVSPGRLRHQTLPVETVGAEALLICRQDLSEDTVYALTKALFRSLPTLAAAHREAALIDPDQGPATSIPLHPGAARYYREREILR